MNDRFKIKLDGFPCSVLAEREAEIRRARPESSETVNVIVQQVSSVVLLERQAQTLAFVMFNYENHSREIRSRLAPQSSGRSIRSEENKVVDGTASILASLMTARRYGYETDALAHQVQHFLRDSDDVSK